MGAHLVEAGRSKMLDIDEALKTILNWIEKGQKVDAILLNWSQAV
jgi:hypothetical protein